MMRSIRLLAISLSMAGAALAQDLTTGLVGHWELDETAGTVAADASGNGNHGTHVNGPVVSTDIPALISHFSDRSLAFAAAADTSVTVPDSASLSIAGSITLAAWIKPTVDATIQQGIVEKWTAATGSAGYFLRLSSGECVTFCLLQEGGTAEITTTPRAVPLNVWTHVAGVYDSGTQTLRIYVNGTMDPTTGTGAGPVDGAGPLMIGNAQGSNQFTGLIDDVRVYARALTDADVAALAAGGGAPSAPPAIPPAVLPPAGGGGSSGEGENGDDGINDSCPGGSIAGVHGPAGWMAAIAGLALSLFRRRR
jgi:hypothetical protein